MSNVDRLLRSIGKTSFVEYFIEYIELALSKDKLTRDDKVPLAKKLLQNNPNARKTIRTND